MAFIQVRLEKNNYDPTNQTTAQASGADFFSILNDNSLPGATQQLAIMRKFRITVTEIREDNVDEVIPHKLVYEFDNVNGINGTLIDEAPKGTPTGPILNQAVLFQHGDARTGNGLGGSPDIDPTLLEGAATFAFFVPDFRGADGLFQGKDTGNNDVLVNGLTVQTPPTPSILPVGVEPISSYNRIFTETPPATNIYQHDEVNRQGKLRLKIEKKVDGAYLEMGNKTVSFNTINAVPSPNVTVGADFETYIGTITVPYDECDAFAVLLSTTSVQAFTDLVNGQSVGFAGMSDLAGQYAHLSTPGSVDCAAAAAAMMDDMISSGMPFPGFPNGLDVANLPPPQVPGLIPPKLDKIIKGVTDILDTAAMVAGAPASIPQIIEKLQREICEIINSMVAVQELRASEHLCIELPLRLDLIGTPDFDLQNIDKKLIVCTNDPATPIGSVLNAITAEHIHGLTADSPEEFSLSDRIEQITLLSREQIERQLQKAIDDGKIADITPASLRAQVVRQLDALVANLGDLPKCEIDPAGNAFALVDTWANAPDLDIFDFWQSTVVGNVGHERGHLDLVACFVTRGHQPLMDVLIEYLMVATANINIADLIALDYLEWVNFFYPHLSNIYCNESMTQATNRFLQQAAIIKVRLDFDLATASLDDVLQELTGLDPAVDVIYFDGTLTNTPLNTGLKTVIETYLGIGTGTLSVNDLKNLDSSDWQSIIGNGYNATIPPTTNPILLEEVEKLLKEIGRCWTIPCILPTSTPTVVAPATFDCLIDNCLADTITTAGLTFGTITSVDLDAIPSLDECCRAAILTIDELHRATTIVTTPGLTPALQFSLMEALYAKGFTSRSAITDIPSYDFKEALIGTIAYDQADAIYVEVGGVLSAAAASTFGGFVPVNPNGNLRNCIPPKHLSVLSPVSYLKDLLTLKEDSNCEAPTGVSGAALKTLVEARRGVITDLEVSENNLCVPIPKIDIVNESLEHLVVSGGSQGSIYNTNKNELKGITLTDKNKVQLFCAIPEHSAPTITTTAYDTLKSTFTVPGLPYNLSQDSSNAYLEELGLNLFDLKRRFREEITEFMLDPTLATTPSGNFKSQLWRYPVRFEIAREYLGISAEEYTELFENNISGVFRYYGFSNGAGWVNAVRILPEFLQRTGLCYDEFFDLWKSEFVVFSNGAAGIPFSAEEPHDLAVISIQGLNGVKLRKLKIFITLWQKLQTIPNTRYSFEELRDIAEVLELYNGNDINPDFIRQLAAFQVLRDDFGLDLKDESDTTPGTGANRNHLLALWVGTGAAKWDWALEHLLLQINLYCEKKYQCSSRPEIIKILKNNLDGIADLANFASAEAAYTWYKLPTHTIRFVEVLCKIYASEWDVEELFYLFTTPNPENLGGEDPFSMQSESEAEKCPFDLPECSDFPLSKLREQLCAVTFETLEQKGWDACSWKEIQLILKKEFGFNKPDLLNSICLHFFPQKANCDCTDAENEQTWYCVDLAATDTSNDMWDEPVGSPFFYDEAKEKLCFTLPLLHEEVIEKLQTDKLNDTEKLAVRDLFFLPRKELTQLGFLFPNQLAAIEYLLQESDANQRWVFFQKSFAVFYQRCHTIAQFLADHIASVDIADDFKGDKEVMWEILKRLYADENRSIDPIHEWEDNDGTLPNVHWDLLPNGGAFAAINGLVGTGLLGEYFLLEDGEMTNTLLWREVRSPMSSFGEFANIANAPVNTIIPPIEWDDTTRNLITICNGFAIDNKNGDVLGGALSYGVRWSGILLIHQRGNYTFQVGMPTPEEQAPDYDANSLPRWKVTLKRFQQKEITVLSKGFGEAHIPCDCSASVALLPCAYEIIIEYINPVPDFDRAEEICPQTTGFQLKYSGPDTEDKLITLPFHNLYRTIKDSDLGDLVVNAPIPDKALAVVKGNARQFLDDFYTSTIRDIRRTYQRAFKAGLFVRRFTLSAEKTTRNQSELSYLLDHAADFAGTSYYLTGGNFVAHKAHFNLNLLPVHDVYRIPASIYDDRYTPSVQRQQALFDWWERIFDHKQLEKAVSTFTNRPLWELYLYENDENIPADPPQANRIERYLGSNLNFTNIDALLNYAPSFSLTHNDLNREEWAIRIYQSALILNEIADNIGAEKGLTNVLPANWADGTDLDKLADFVCQSLLADCDPPRYKAVEQISNKLRCNARNALVTYLTADATAPSLPDDTKITNAKQLSELLLLDVEAGICEKASRIEEGITAIQHFVRRYRLGLETTTTTTNQQLQFAHLWDKQFATFNLWKKCKLRSCYQENWLEYDRLAEARKTESFRFLEDRLRRQTLTVPITKELPNPAPANNVGGTLLQLREPAITQNFGIDKTSHKQIVRQGFDQIATPKKSGRSSWLTSILDDKFKTPYPKVPYWIEAAIRLGKNFVRVAAAGQPPNRLYCEHHDSACCEDCNQSHIPMIDEYYFWLVDSNFYEQVTQDARWKWHSDSELPTLLHWQAEKQVLLAWTKIHNREFQQLRFSNEAVHVVEGVNPDIEFLGRTADSLQFKVTGGITPVGFPNNPEPGFRYDLATDSAVVLPQLINPLSSYTSIGGLTAFPSFAYFASGATGMPSSLFSTVLTIAANLRAHCRFEVALKTYEQVYNPLQQDNTWNSLSEQNKAIVLHYLDTLLEWGDALMKQHSPESFQQARLVYDTACKLLGTCPTTIIETNTVTTATIASIATNKKGLNPRLMNIFETTEDRLDLIRSCQNAYRYKNGKVNKDMLYFGNSSFRNGWQQNMDICADELDNCLPQSPYRFTFLLQKAQEFAGEVTSLGAALLSAYEKGDGEYLASLRGYHEKQLLELALVVRQDQWRASDWDVQGLYKTKEMAQIRLAYNQELYNGKLNSGESDYVSYTHLSLTELILSKAIEIGAQILRGIPDVLAGFPQMHLPLGSKMAGFVSTISQVFSTMSQYHGTYAGLRNTEGGWDRREREWLHQIELVTVELQQIERQILASERRRDVALRELNNHVQQIENSKEVFDFMRDKFSNHELYLWMQKETAALHNQMYELALLLARQAERAYNFERGFTAKKFIDGNMIWDNLHEGMLAGERLQHTLRRMEQTYYNENVREYELTKHISLRQHFPLEFLILKETGCCTIELPEWLFDMDYPGHYMRRIKNVTLSIPCVVGPYVGVHCRLTLLSSRTRTQPHLHKNLDESCKTENGVNNGYAALPDDSRWVHQFIASQAITTSSGQQDSGMFELNFNDDRYLPFEYAGAVSCWRIELPKENNYFDMDALGDVIMHVNYMAREGGELLRKAAVEVTEHHLPGNGKRLLDVKHDLSQAWHHMMACDVQEENRFLKLELIQQMFPYLPCSQQIHLKGIEVIMEIDSGFKQKQFNIDFIPNEKNCNTRVENGKPFDFSINCIATTDWKVNCDTNNIYQGTIDIQKAGILLNSKKQYIGQLSISKDIAEIKNFYMILKYDKGHRNQS